MLNRGMRFLVDRNPFFYYNIRVNLTAAKCRIFPLLMKKSLERAARILIYATFFVPLVVMPSPFIFPFIVPKILFFRSLVEILLGVYILLLIINWQEYKPRLTLLNLAVAAFLLSFTLSTFWGVDPYHSFWDNHERMLGLFTIVHFVIYYFICTAMFRTWADWRTVLRWFLLAGSGVILVAFAQTQDPSLLLNNGSGRVASTLGNSIYVGGYGLFLTFVAFLLAIREKDNVWRAVEIALGLLAFLGMFWSGTRGSILGFVAGAATVLIGYIIVLKDYKKIRWSLIWIAILGVGLIGLLYGFRKTNFVTNLPAIGRTVNTTLAEVQASPRWIAWTIAIQSWKDKPIVGWGPNNFFYAFNKHYNPRSLDFGYGETWFDNAHNIILNTLAVQGAFGILTYLAIFVVGILSLILARRRSNLNVHLAVVGVAFLVAHLVGNVTVFENPTSYLYFMFWLALVNGASWPQLEQKTDLAEDKNRKLVATTSILSDRRVGAGAFVSIGVVVLILIFVFNVQPARANMMTLGAVRYLSQDATIAVPAMKAALDFNSPHIDDIRADIGRSASQILGSLSEKLGRDRSNEILQLVYENLKKNLVLHPLDIRNQLILSQLAQLGATINQNENFLLDREKFLEDALAKSPRRQQVEYGLAELKMQISKNDEAFKLMERAIDDNPRIAESYWRLAYFYIVSGNTVRAREVINLAEKSGVVWSEQDISVINKIFSTTAAPTVKSE